MTVLRTDAYDVIRQRRDRRYRAPPAAAGTPARRGARARSSGRSTTISAAPGSARSVPLGDPRAMAQRVLRSITDLGPLTELLARRDVEEIFVEGARVTYLDTDGPVARPRRADDRGREPPDPRPAAGRRPSGSSTRSIRWCRRECSTAPHASRPRSRRSPTGSRQRSGATRCATSRSTSSSRATRSRRRPPRSSGRSMQLRSRIVDLRRAGSREDDAGRRAARRRYRRALRAVLRGDPRARGADRRTARTTKCVRPGSTAPARSRCAIS